MDVSVVIPTLHELERIADTVRKTWEAGAEEIIVVDGGSRDGTAEAARGAGAEVILSPPGRAVQQNAGADQSRGDVLLFQHADAWLEPGGVEQIKQTLQDPRVAGGAFRQHIEASGFCFRLIEWGNARRTMWFRLAYGDQGIFMRKDFFHQIGGFPAVPLMEDVMLMDAFRRRCRPVLLPGPLHVSPRRWIRYGVIRQTLRNWSLLLAYRCGVSPERLARHYPRH